jgi:hypothetical protein
MKQEFLTIYDVAIIQSEYTPEVEDWYIGWFHFTVDNPYGIEEAWVEYYNSTSSSTTNMVWQKQILNNELDWEFATFILPKTKYTLVRWYVVDKEWNKKYTNQNGQIISSEVNFYTYYDLGIAPTDDWVDVAFVPIIVGAIFLTGLWITAYTCVNTWIISAACGIEVALTVVPVWRVASWWWKLVPKSFVTRFYNSSVLKIFADSVGKLVDDVAKLWLKVKVQYAILNKNIAGKTLKTVDGNTFTIPNDWVKHTASWNWGGARYVSPDWTKQIRVMANGIDVNKPSTLRKPYMRAQKIWETQAYDLDFNPVNSWVYSDSHFPIISIN